MLAGWHVQRGGSTALEHFTGLPVQAKEILEEMGFGGTTVVVGGATIAGFFAAACSLPFDYVKTQMQKMKPDPVTGAVPYTVSLVWWGALPVMQTLLWENGVQAWVALLGRLLQLWRVVLTRPYLITTYRTACRTLLIVQSRRCEARVLWDFTLGSQLM